MVETGVGWLPHFLEQLDDRYWRYRSWGMPLTVNEPPSHYWYRNMSATFIIDRAAVELRSLAGVKNIMWSSDYPHHGNDWPNSLKVIDQMMGHIPRPERDQIVAQNAVRLYRLDG
jgi:predicted TIM-barrel fold metal-dependent hydrolase